MSRSRTAIFTARVAAFAIALAVPVLGASVVASADTCAPATSSATVNGDDWIG